MTNEQDRQSDAGRLALPERQALPVSTPKVVMVGLGLWVVAFIVTLLVPALHTGERHWWPEACVAGFVLGLMGLGYMARGRGNASDVDH